MCKQYNFYTYDRNLLLERTNIMIPKSAGAFLSTLVNIITYPTWFLNCAVQLYFLFMSTYIYKLRYIPKSIYFLIWIAILRIIPINLLESIRYVYNTVFMTFILLVTFYISYYIWLSTKSNKSLWSLCCI